jgi:hypothetical protein
MNKQNDTKAMENLKAATRQLARLTWQMAQAGAPLKGEQATLAKVMREHPEYADIWEHLDELSDAEIECDGVTPIIHVQMHNERMKTEALLVLRMQSRNLKVAKRAILLSRLTHCGEVTRPPRCMTEIAQNPLGDFILKASGRIVYSLMWAGYRN